MATGKQALKQPEKQAATAPVAAPAADVKAQMELGERHRQVEEIEKQRQAAQGPPWTQPPEEEPEDQEDEQEAAGEATQKDLTTADAMVVAQIGEIDRQGRVELRAGNVAYMKSRHEIGKPLETNYGGKARQERGKRVVKEVSRRYDISTSELYRCWKFFKLRPDFDAFCNEFPDVTSWTAAKELLPSLEGGDIEAKRKKHEHQALIERINDDLKAFRKGLAGDLRGNVPPNKLRELADQLRDTSQEVVRLVIIPGQVFDDDGKPIGVQQPAAT